MITATTRRPTKPESKLIDLIPSVAYVRMSTSQQEDSPERQRRQITDYAQRHGYNVIKWYEDHGMSGTESLNRAGYQQLLSDSTMGAFSAVLISEMSRLSREDLFTVFPQWGAFKDAGITLVSCQRGVIDFSSLGGIICALVDQYSSHDESKKFANRSITGKINSLLNGNRVSGTRIFGFDRNIVDGSGHVLKRVHFREQFIKPISCQSVLVPSVETACVKAIQWAFKHVDSGGSLMSVADRFNDQGLASMNGKKFSVKVVREMLTNPSYYGASRAGNDCRGKFSRISDTHDPILMENTHAGIVDKAMFERVATLINGKAQRRDTWQTYLVSGLAKCGHCGNSLCGNHSHKDKQTHRYICWMDATTAKRRDREPCPVLPGFDGPLLERAVIRAWADVYLVDDVAAQLKLKPAQDHSQHEKSELKTIGEQIQRGEVNLTLAASPADHKAMSSVLAGLRKRESELRDKLSKMNRKLADLDPEILQAVKELKDFRDLLLDWPNVGTEKDLEQLTQLLRIVLKETISSVVLKNEDREYSLYGRPSKFRWLSGVLTFNHAHLAAPDVILTDEMLAHPLRRQYRQVSQYLRDAGHPMTVLELMSALGRQDQSILRALQLCEIEGTVKRIAGEWKNSMWTACN